MMTNVQTAVLTNDAQKILMTTYIHTYLCSLCSFGSLLTHIILHSSTSLKRFWSPSQTLTSSKFKNSSLTSWCIEFSSVILKMGMAQLRGGRPSGKSICLPLFLASCGGEGPCFSKKSTRKNINHFVLHMFLYMIYVLSAACCLLQSREVSTCRPC
jgi:hypothetical protein